MLVGRIQSAGAWMDAELIVVGAVESIPETLGLFVAFLLLRAVLSGDWAAAISFPRTWPALRSFC